MCDLERFCKSSKIMLKYAFMKIEDTLMEISEL